MDKSQEEPIYRIPPCRYGQQIYMASDIADRIPWSLADRLVPAQWANTKGEGVTVAILDTGLWRHSDLPDPVFAVNFSSSRSVYDAVGHGTHVAGIVGARLNNTGVVGWAPGCQIGCVKVLGDDGSGGDSGIVRGIEYAVQAGADIINLSLGGGYSPAIERACNAAVAAGKFVIAAAGNDGFVPGQNTIGYPARLPTVLAIGSYRKDGKISEFSSRGPEVDMAFPGEDILSTWLNGTFREISGTSMATPAACGLTALMLAAYRKARDTGKPWVHPINNNDELLAHWKRNAVDAGTPGQDSSFGWGLPDVAGIVTPPHTPPAVPPPATPGTDLFLGLKFKAITFEGDPGIFLYMPKN